MKQSLFYSILLVFLIMPAPVINAQVTSNEAPMLERKLAYPDSTTHLPYTNLCFISNAQLPVNSGWLMDDAIKKSNRRSLLIIEMNSSEVWGYKYSSGSLQFVVDVPKFKDSFQFNMTSGKIKVHLINNYGGIESTQDSLEGNLSITKVKGKIKISGKVKITTSKPNTRQVVEFNANLIPEYSLNEFKKIEQEKDLKHEERIQELVELIAGAMMNDTTPILEKQMEDTGAIKEESKPGQGFRLHYSFYGLGSNRFSPDRIIVMVQDSVLKYGIMEPSNEVGYIDFATGDTTWKEKRVWYDVPFSNASKDSILGLLAGKEGQYIFQTNPHVMSGGIVQIYIEYEGWCTDFRLKNACNETGNQIAGFLNPYLPENYKLSTTDIDDWCKDQDEPLIKKCSGSGDKNYIDILGDEYDSIRR